MARNAKTSNQNQEAVQGYATLSSGASESKVPLPQSEQVGYAQVNSNAESLNEKGANSKKTSKKKKSSKKRRRKQAKRFFIKLIVVIAIVFALCYWVVTITPQHGNQMFPSIKDGDLIVTLKVGQQYQAGAVCAYKAPDGKIKIGRIVAMPGDTVAFNEKGALILNDIEAMEEYIIPTSNSSQPKDEDSSESDDTEENDKVETVPTGCYYVLNDRRVETDDSRTYGAIKESDLRGTAFWQFRRREF